MSCVMPQALSASMPLVIGTEITASSGLTVRPLEDLKILQMKPSKF